MLVKDPSSKANQPGTFNNSLTRNVVISLLLLTIIPVVAIVSVMFLRTRTVLQDMVSQQLDTIVESYAIQLEDLASARLALLEQTVDDLAIQYDLSILLKDEAQAQAAEDRLIAAFDKIVRNPGERTFDHLLVMDPDGTVLIATNDAWVGLDLSTMPNHPGFEGDRDTILSYDAWPLYPGKLVIFAYHHYVDQRTGNQAIVIGTVLNPLPVSLLSSAQSFFTSGEAYFYTTANQLIGLDSAKQDLSLFKVGPQQEAQLKALRARPANTGVEINSPSRPVLAYAQWIPGLKAALLVAAPQAVAYQPVRALIPFSALLLAVYLVVIGTFLYSGVARLVRPLLLLSEKARQFAKGDFSQRAEVNRKDEIGLLAHSFNQMVEDISVLYQSLEDKVEERTRQLRIATEVAVVATSAVERHEVLRRTVELLTARFGYHYAAAFLIDETGSFAVLKEVASVSEEAQKLKGSRISISKQNALGQVAGSNQALVISDTTKELGQAGRMLVASTRSQVILPIAIGHQILGVLDIQSATTDSFDPETVTVLQGLANQVATGLRNIQLMDSTQINLEETSHLSRSGRLITKATSQEEVIQILTETLAQIGYVSALFEVDQNSLRLLALHDTKQSSTDSDLQGLSLPFPNGADRLKEGSPIIANDLNKVEVLDNLFGLMRQRDCRAVAIIPVLKDGEPDYLIVLGTRDQRLLSSTGLQPYVNLAEIVGNTVERISLVTVLRQRLFELETVATIGETISAEINLEHIFEVLHQQIGERMGTDLSFGIALFHAEQNMIEIPFITSGTERLRLDPFPLGDGLTSYIIQKRQPLLLVHNVEQQAQEMGARIVGEPARSWLGVPLISAGDVLGAMIVQDVDTEGRFTQDDLKLFTTLAPLVANILRNTRLLSDMQQAIQSYDQERFLLNSLLANIPEDVYFKDRTGQYIRVSQSFAERYLKDPADFIGITDVDLDDTHIGSAYYERDQMILREGEAEIGQIVSVRGPDGPSWLLTSRIPLKDDAGETVGLLGLAQDITELKRAERLMERRARQIQTASEVARDTTGTLEVDEILHRAVELIRSRFNFYHASIFLVDPAGEYAVLRESSGEIGQRLKATGHKLAVGSQSLIGRATATRESIVVNNVRDDPDYYANPLTPETNAEAVIPMIAGDNVLGALDVQSAFVGAFLEEDIHTLQILADQLAVAVMNANLFARMQEHLAKHRLLHHITSEATASEELSETLHAIVTGLNVALPNDQISLFLINDEGELQVRESIGYDRVDLSHLRIPLGRGIVGLAGLEKKPIRIDDTLSDPRYLEYQTGIRSELAVPILFMDEVIGVLNIESPRPAAYDENDQEILGTLGNNIGAIIANTRLLAQVRQQTERQKKLFDITSKIRRSVDVEAILQTSAAELARVMNARWAKIEITGGQTDTPPTAVESDLTQNDQGDPEGYRSNGKNGTEAAG